MNAEGSLVPLERIENIIHQIRGARVLLDEDPAELYNVETGALVRREGRRYAPYAFTEIVFDAIRHMMTPPIPSQRKIGIRQSDEEGRD